MVHFYSVVSTMGNNRVSNRDIFELLQEVNDRSIRTQTDLLEFKKGASRRFKWLEDEGNKNMVAREQLKSYLTDHKETKAYRFSIVSIVVSAVSVILQFLGL